MAGKETPAVTFFFFFFIELEFTFKVLVTSQNSLFYTLNAD